ncbi:MAG: hypothetical protein NPINA01_01550 [Nitrospinaceae bacterium]|nr:MAG: hypothetical protein NPINA01_01550 [Nitrospinaceae bacterium]
MNFRILVVCVLSFGLMLLVNACATHTVSSDKPDLIAEPLTNTGGPKAYCRKNGNDLVVQVRNQSAVGSDQASRTQVTFFNGVDLKKVTGALAGGATEDVTFPMPPSCFNPDCRFKIMVDADNDIDESPGETPDNREFNNDAEGVCAG